MADIAKFTVEEIEDVYNRNGKRNFQAGLMAVAEYAAKRQANSVTLVERLAAAYHRMRWYMEPTQFGGINLFIPFNQLDENRRGELRTLAINAIANFGHEWAEKYIDVMGEK